MRCISNDIQPRTVTKDALPIAQDPSAQFGVFAQRRRSRLLQEVFHLALDVAPRATADRFLPLRLRRSEKFFRSRRSVEMIVERRIEPESGRDDVELPIRNERIGGLRESLHEVAFTSMYGAQYASVERIDHLPAELQKVVSNRVAWEMKSVQFLASVLDPASEC